MQRLFPLVLLSLLAAAVVVPLGADALVPKCVVGGRCDAGYAVCQDVEPVVDTVIVTLGGAIPVQVVRSVVLQTGVNCLPGTGGACPFFRATPAGPIHFAEAHPVGAFADCLAVLSAATVGQGASVRVLGGGCHAYAYVYTSGGNSASTPVLYWTWCP